MLRKSVLKVVTSIKMSEVLKQEEVEKIRLIIDCLEKDGMITLQKATEVCSKSATTVRRYLQIFVKTGLIVAEGKTNKTVYKSVLKSR